MERYGKAVIDERTNPRHLAEIAAYLRREYGPGTGPSYIFADMADGGRGPRRGPGGILRDILHALSRALRALMPSNGLKPEPETPKPAR
jgi:hypothetical protein